MHIVRGEGANNAIVDVLDFTKQVDLKSIRSVTSQALAQWEGYTPNIFNSTSSSASILESIRAYEKDMIARAGPSVENSRKACLDAHDFSVIKAGNSPLVARRVLKS